MKISGQFSPNKQNTNTSALVQNDHKRKMVNFLETALKQETEKRQSAEKELLEYRYRSLRIQNQFSRLLQKYDNHVAVVNGRLSYSQQIWDRLINEIQNFNQNSQEMLEKRCSEIYLLMNRRINQIMEKAEFQIQKTKKLSEDEFSSIRQEIKQALSLSRQIQSQNIAIKKINKDLQFKVNILRQEKGLLVEQLTQKKLLLMKFNRIYLQCSKNSIQSPRPQSKKLKSNRQHMSIPKFICEPSINQTNSLNPETSRLSSIQKLKKQSFYLKTDNHLKICFERQKRKNGDLKSLVAKLQSKCIDVGSLIQKTLKDIPKKILGVQKAVILSDLINQIKLKLIISQYEPKKGLSQKQITELLHLQY